MDEGRGGGSKAHGFHPKLRELLLHCLAGSEKVHRERIRPALVRVVRIRVLPGPPQIETPAGPIEQHVEELVRHREPEPRAEAVVPMRQVHDNGRAMKLINEREPPELIVREWRQDQTNAQGREKIRRLYGGQTQAELLTHTLRRGYALAPFRLARRRQGFGTPWMRGRPGQKALETPAVKAHLGRDPAQMSDGGRLHVGAKCPILASKESRVTLHGGFLGKKDVRIKTHQYRQPLERSQGNVGGPLLERAHDLLRDPGQGRHLRHRQAAGPARPNEALRQASSIHGHTLEDVLRPVKDIRETGHPGDRHGNHDPRDAEIEGEPHACPGIYFAAEPAGRVAKIAGTGLGVWEVLGDFVEDQDVELLKKAFHELSASQIRAALFYFSCYPDEIRAKIDANAALTPEVVEQRYPGLIRVVRVD